MAENLQNKKIEFIPIYPDTTQFGAGGFEIGRLDKDTSVIRGKLQDVKGEIKYNALIQENQDQRFRLTMAYPRTFLDRDTWNSQIVEIVGNKGLNFAAIMMENEDGLSPWLSLSLEDPGLITVLRQGIQIHVLPGFLPSAMGLVIDNPENCEAIPVSEMVSITKHSSIFKVDSDAQGRDAFVKSLRLVVYAGVVGYQRKKAAKSFVFEANLPGTQTDFSHIINRIKSPYNPLSFVIPLARSFQSSFRFATLKEEEEIGMIRRMKKR